MLSEEKLKEEIFERVRQVYRLRKEKEEFIPGKTYIPCAGRVYDENEMISLVDSALEFWLTYGRYGKKFEEEMASFLGIKHVVVANSGSSANLLAMTALTSPRLGERRLKPGDEVITVAASFPTTVNPIIQNRLVPVFVDVELGTYNIDTDAMERALSEKTRAVFIAHTLGNPFDIDRVLKFKERHRLFLIEDTCDALGSSYKGRYAGTFGDIGTLSFYPAHHITMGEGGAVLTDSTGLKNIIESFRDWGRDCWCGSGKDDTCGKRFSWKLGELPFGYDHKYVYSHIGYNLKPTDLQAAVGVEQLKKLPGFKEKRKRNFEKLLRGLEKHEKYFILPSATPNSDPSWFGFLLTVRKEAPFSKNEIIGFLEDRRIATRPLFAGNILRHPAYSGVEYRVCGPLDNSEIIMERTFWIGLYPGIEDRQLEYVLDAFDTFLKRFEK